MEGWEEGSRAGKGRGQCAEHCELQAGIVVLREDF